MSKKIIKECPMCGGTGQIGVHPRLTPILKEAHIKEAARLRKEGYTLRQIAVFLGHEHPQTVQNLLNQSKQQENNHE